MNDGEKPQTPADREAKAKRRILVGIADAHIKDTGHSGYSTNVPITGEVLVSEGFTREVTDSPAYDESVPDKLVCTLCGEEKPATAE